MKVALFGATGGTGLAFLEQAAEQGVEVVAFARNPQPLQEKFPQLKVVRASIDDMGILLAEVKGFDAIVSVVGVNGLWAARKVNGLYEKTARNLLQVAQSNGIQRLVVVTSGGVIEAPGEPWFFRYLLKPFFLKAMYEDMLVMEALVQNSALNYTIVRPPFLTSGPLTGKYRVILDQWFDDDKDLSRQDLAHFLLRTLSDPSTVRHIAGVSY